MEKNFNCFWKQIPFVHFFVFCCLNIYPQKGINISISIGHIEFDCPNFTVLRKHPAPNQKAKNINQNYSTGTAKISLAYNSSPFDFWDNSPASVLQLFKLNSIDGKSIALKLKSPVPENDAEEKVITTNTNKSVGCTICYIDLSTNMTG